MLLTYHEQFCTNTLTYIIGIKTNYNGSDIGMKINISLDTYNKMLADESFRKILINSLTEDMILYVQDLNHLASGDYANLIYKLLENKINWKKEGF